VWVTLPSDDRLAREDLSAPMRADRPGHEQVVAASSTRSQVRFRACRGARMTDTLIREYCLSNHVEREYLRHTAIHTEARE
jgi:hypothetical protein